MGPNFHHLEIFHAVARLGSFSKASEELLIGQPSVSLQIRDLERYYGAPLFHRQGRKIRLTDIGEIVYRYTEQIFKTSNEMERAVDRLKQAVTGRLVLGASSTPGEYLAPRLLGRFTKIYPGVEVSLQIANTSHVIAQVVARNIDLGLVGAKADNPSVEAKEIYTDRLAVFAAPDHPLASRKSVHLTELVQHPFVMRENGSATRSVAEDYFKKLDLPIKMSMEVSNNEAVKRAVAAGLGVGVLSSLALEVDLAAGAVQLVDVPVFDCRRSFYILHHRQAYLSRVQQAFLDLIPDLPES
ncbi:MAG: LysR family transcriptional regulator [SAR202 cluster bacterium]|nr:LysR family transcriptional regulator [SAR202 cluster bacterium]